MIRRALLTCAISLSIACAPLEDFDARRKVICEQGRYADLVDQSGLDPVRLIDNGVIQSDRKEEFGRRRWVIRACSPMPSQTRQRNFR